MAAAAGRSIPAPRTTPVRSDRSCRLRGLRDCLDNDGDGLVDLDDPDCCADVQTLTVTRTRRPRNTLKVEGRLAYAKTLLGITDDQAPAWKVFEDVSRANVQSLGAAHDAEMAALGSPIDRMQAQTDMMQAQLDARKALLPATEALYNVLTPDQRERADVVLLLLGSSAGVNVEQR